MSLVSRSNSLQVLPNAKGPSKVDLMRQIQSQVNHDSAIT